MSIVSAVGMRCLKRVGFATLCTAGMMIGAEVSPAVDDLPNACPVDGCSVKIIAVKQAGDEMQLTLKANFSPDMSKNHIHVWWGDNYTVEQVSNNAETGLQGKAGEWHPMADYPSTSPKAPRRPRAEAMRRRYASVPPTATTISST